MSLFGFEKKKDEVKEVKGNCCDEAGDAKSIKNTKPVLAGGEPVKVLGSGCVKCNELETNVKKALEQLDMDTTIEHITDFTQIASYGVMSTPALVVDGKVVAYGKVLKVEEVIKILEKVRS